MGGVEAPWLTLEPPPSVEWTNQTGVSIICQGLIARCSCFEFKKKSIMKSLKDDQFNLKITWNFNWNELRNDYIPFGNGHSQRRSSTTDQLDLIRRRKRPAGYSRAPTGDCSQRNVDVFTVRRHLLPTRHSFRNDPLQRFQFRRNCPQQGRQNQSRSVSNPSK